MNNYNDLIGQLVEYRTETFSEFFQMMKPNPVALGLIAEVNEDTGNEYIRVEWLVNPHYYTLFDINEINKFGLTLKDNEEWRS
jgi:hypothetical protein